MIFFQIPIEFVKNAKWQIFLRIARTRISFLKCLQISNPPILPVFSLHLFVFRWKCLSRAPRLSCKSIVVPRSNGSQGGVFFIWAFFLPKKTPTWKKNAQKKRPKKNANFWKIKFWAFFILLKNWRKNTL